MSSWPNTHYIRPRLAVRVEMHRHISVAIGERANGIAAHTSPVVTETVKKPKKGRARRKGKQKRPRGEGYGTGVATLTRTPADAKGRRYM